MTCKPAWRGFAATRGHGQKRVSNRVGRPCSSRKGVLRVVCAGSTSVPRARRATMKSGDRDLKRATRACGFGLERLPWPGDGLFASACLDCYLARSARDSRAAAQIKLSLSRSHYERAAGAEKL